MSRQKIYPPPCAWPNCNMPSVARGFCSRHYGEFKRHCVANGSWGNADDRYEAQRRLTQPESEKWEWAGDEAALIALTEQREREQQAKDSKAEETYHDRYRTFHSR